MKPFQDMTQNCEEDVHVLHKAFTKEMDCLFILAGVCHLILCDEFPLRICFKQLRIDWVLNCLQCWIAHLYAYFLTSKVHTDLNLLLLLRRSYICLYVSLTRSHLMARGCKEKETFCDRLNGDCDSHDHCSFNFSNCYCPY